MSDLRSASAQALLDRIKGGGFAVALSGGGHRATLASLGSLLALVDRGLGRKIIQIASVSGGSITNAFVAQRVRLDRLGPGELDATATELANTVVRQGVLTKGWIGLLILIPVGVGVALGAVSQTVLKFPGWLGIAVGLACALALLLCRGLAVEWLLERRYFGGARAGGTDRTRARLSSLSGRDIEHVFCMTDLALGLPVYASSHHGGYAWRRLRSERIGPWDIMPFQTFHSSGFSLAAIVRASAAFPGIPPWKIRIPADPDVPQVAESPRVAFLADGGVWNNLGSQVIREDGFLGQRAAWYNGVLRPYGPAPKDLPLLCFNGSAPLTPSKPWAFSIPGIALLRSLLQTTEILNANTVLPRVQSMRRAFERRVWSGSRPNHLDPADLVADLRSVEDVSRDLLAGTWKNEYIQKTDPAVKEWERDALMRIRLARQHCEDKSETDWLSYVLGKTPEPEGALSVGGFANVDEWRALRDADSWKQLVDDYGSGSLSAPTTLGRIDPTLARRLIARGYLNTYLVSLFLAPLTEDEIPRLAMFGERLDRIVGIQPVRPTSRPREAEGRGAA